MKIQLFMVQTVDVNLFHFWKNLTKGKHLWLRNNFSTFASQIIDSTTVILLLCAFELLPWDIFWGLVISSVIFKILVAALDTPFLYLFVGIIRRQFKLNIGEEIQL